LAVVGLWRRRCRDHGRAATWTAFPEIIVEPAGLTAP
jgi:hypothetical protein